MKITKIEKKKRLYLLEIDNETPASATITLIFIAFFGLVSIFEPLLKAE